MKIYYANKPDYEFVDKEKKLARLKSDFHFWVDHKLYVIKAGFEWDGASIPWVLRWKYGSPFDAVHLVGGLVHDASYANAVYIPTEVTPNYIPCHLASFTRFKADNIYFAFIRKMGATVLRAFKEWLAVRVFGFSHWYNYKKGQVMKTIMKILGAVAASLVALVVLAGCTTKTRSVELAGMYASETGTLAIGSVDIMASPTGEESAFIKYDEDTAWLSPSTKLHDIKIMITGTNSVSKVDSIVKDICKAFIAVKPTNTEIDKGKEKE